MFEKLVVSSIQRRRGRTPKFFLGTVVVYSTAVAIAFALSVLLSAPKLADSNLVSVCPGLIASPRPLAVDKVVVDTSGSNGGATQNLQNLRNLDYLIQHPETGARRTIPVTTDLVVGDGGAGGDPNAPPIGIGVISGDPRATEAPPRPPDPPNSSPRTDVFKAPLRLTSTVLQGKVIERVVPVYPQLARTIRLHGDVSTEVIISPEGRVESVRVVSGHPMLVQAAIDAARRWRFEPTILNGVPVRVTGVITFVFKLNE